jgi:hypothetical protein
MQCSGVFMGGQGEPRKGRAHPDCGTFTDPRPQPDDCVLHHTRLQIGAMRDDGIGHLTVKDLGRRQEARRCVDWRVRVIKFETWWLHTDRDRNRDHRPHYTLALSRLSALRDDVNTMQRHHAGIAMQCPACREMNVSKRTPELQEQGSPRRMT